MSGNSDLNETKNVIKAPESLTNQSQEFHKQSNIK
jgi:hypothetical protein